VEFEIIEKNLGYAFKDRKLLLTALTHRSYINEVRVVRNDHNERLEFLGDAILQLVSSDYLFKRFTKLSEGELSKLRASAVCETALYERAMKLGLGEHVQLGVGAEKEGGREKPSILSDALESVIAAIYLDGGLEPARDFVLREVLTDIEFDEDVVDAKTRLQMYYQKTTHETVSYRVISEEGPSNNKSFIVQAYIGEKALETGSGSSKKAAEKQAALNTLKKIKE